ncbi:pilus assembly protein CpaD [Novosphingobium chloroacetimidivorans]|uniref:Pilus assembly protein CpaD n=1 Tax=Novosphingobium chloroacetimidivorans TaxID=1428314 RepID=A0A7W7NXC0_9SPHN|nr:CpaD family pilus assembly protein [Novosphingobium chloroacetimidivorans]MBB4860241.1 pilus assembly protein CpaD [Novosphingobium chloroacetimidivorans]
MKHRILSIAALALGASLAGCTGMPTNSSMNSVHEPVVERVNYTLDLATGNGGLSYPEQQRLAGWFEELGLRYGDAISVQDPMQSPETRGTIAALAARYSLDLSDTVPVSTGFVEAGTTRVVVTRGKAVVHGCPDWSGHSDANFKNGLSRNYGCATNSNLAAMIANPEHLVKGDGSQGDTTIMSSNKAISAYRAKTPTGSADLKSSSTKGN